MARHHGGERVNAGFYFNLTSWQVTTLSGEGGVLPGEGTSEYLRVPLPVLLAMAPMMGAAFAIFLPFIGIALAAEYGAKRLWNVGRDAVDASVTALGPQASTGEAYFTGEADKKTGQPLDAALAAKLEVLEKAIDAHEANERKPVRK